MRNIFLLFISFLFLACTHGNSPSKLLRQANTYFENEQYSDAIPLYMQAAEKGSAEAQFYLGNCYRQGYGVTQDHSHAVHWYRKAAEQGYANAQNSLGSCYKNGFGVAQDYYQAVQWYRMESV